MVDPMSNSRSDRAAALETWADNVDIEDLKEADTSSLRQIAELAEDRAVVDNKLIEAVRAARQSNRSWSEIGAMLGVSKQAAQRKYSPLVATG